MQDIYRQLLVILISIWRRRWYVVAIAWAFSAAGWVMVAKMPDRFESSARIYVDMDTMLGPLMRGLAVEMNIFQQIDIMQRTLLSRPNLEKVVLMTDLDLTVNSEEQKEALLGRLKKNIVVLQQSRNLFKVSFGSKDPAMTKRVVQAVLQIFVEGNVGASRKDMETARRFIDDQIRDYERQLVEAETRVSDFKRKNMGLMPGEGNYYTRMQEMRTRLKGSEDKLAEEITLRNELVQQLKGVSQFLEMAAAPMPMLAGGAGFAGTGPGPESDLQVRILELEKTIDSLLTRYTKKHPDVVVVQRRLDALNAELKEEQEAMLAGLDQAGEDSFGEQEGAAMNVVPNPVYEQIKFQLVQQEAMTAALRGRVRTERKDLEKGAQMADLVPQVEAELVRLNRDYEIIKRNYEQLRSRKESAKLARDLETKAQKVQFRIVEPPKMPIAPSGPNRPFLLSLVLVAGLAAGIAFAFVLGQINSTFSSVEQLRTKFVLPVLGGITAIMSAKDRHRRVREVLGFGLATASLMVAFVGLQAVEVLGPGGLTRVIKDLGFV